MDVLIDEFVVIALVHIEEEVDRFAGNLFRHFAMTFIDLVAIVYRNAICNISPSRGLDVINIYFLPKRLDRNNFSFL